MPCTTPYTETHTRARDWRWAMLLLLALAHGAASAASARTPLVVVSEARTAAVIKQVPLTGTVTSPRVARLSAQVSGEVEVLKVEVGNRVDADELLLKLDSELEELTLEASRAETQQAQAELADVRRRYTDAQRLRKQSSISINEIELLKAEVQVDEATLKKYTAEERKQQALVKRHSITAPFAGVISERFTEVGEWIDPGNPVLTLIAIDDLRVEFRVPQEFFMHIDDQTQVSIVLDALPGQEFAGKIDAVVPVSDPSARTFLIHVLLDHGETRITPGMSVHGQLRLNTGKQGVVISRDALLRYPDGRVTVWVVSGTGEEATVSERRIRIGHGFDGQVSVTDGLQAGDVIVVQGNESLQEGQTVRIHAPK